MNWRNAGFFILGFIISTILNGICYYFMLLQHFDLFGDIEITAPEERDRTIIAEAFLIVLATTAITYLLHRNGKRYTAVGFWQPAIIGILILMFTVPRFVIKSNYYEPFNKKVWASDRPLKMTRALVKDKSLIGKTKQEVELLLGKGNEGKWELQKFVLYPNEKDVSYLYLEYRNDTVIEAGVGCYCD
jgi:hypothetical protein